MTQSMTNDESEVMDNYRMEMREFEKRYIDGPSIVQQVSNSINYVMDDIYGMDLAMQTWCVY